MDALGDFLRTRRARLTPAQVGLVEYGRRRVPGLRREEVAELAGVSTDYYVRLEQGRGAHVSDSVLDAVGRALRLDATERAYLRALVRPKRAANERRPAVRQSVHLLLEGIEHAPAILVDFRMRVLAANGLAKAVFGIDDDPATHDRARAFFLDPRSRALFADWAGDAETVTASLRLEAARHPGDPWMTALIAELRESSAEFRRLWAGHRVREKDFGTKRLNHPVFGSLVFTYERLAVAGDDERTLIVYQPEPGTRTAERLLSAVG
ncbi:helix-turn-helix transcriptional regulator [Dactylosporangium sp. CS-033363]|uniref:helix-turn-helix transcriptional regulator n=1 Tax=Dactylosporangium sp. CS-033363 TaxID=3239935 RepID=UPI003D8D5AF9